MKTIYLDNAATTPMDPEVVKVMQESMLINFGNPSSVHQFGRKAKVVIESARKNIARHFNVSASEIIFTSGGTEANNLILYNAVENLNVKRIVTSRIEHHAVLNVVQSLCKKFNIEVVYVDLDEKGQVNIKDLENILQNDSIKTLVSLMMVNNEVGNILPLKEVSFLCKKYKTLFHSDTVQAIGHYCIDLQETPIDFIVASAHKFHGPKGVGFICFNSKNIIQPMFNGGGQEKGVRSGTENVDGIVGLEKALDIAYKNLDEHKKHISSLKKYFINNLTTRFKGLTFNGLSSFFELSSYTILSVNFPYQSMLLFNLDLAGIAASGGSACSSGASKGSHVLQEILLDNDLNDRLSVRFSFSKMTAYEDLDIVLDRLSSFFN